MKTLLVLLILSASICLAQEKKPQAKDDLSLSKEKIAQRIENLKQIIQQKTQQRDQLDTEIKVYTGALSQLQTLLSDTTLFFTPEPTKEKMKKPNE